MRRDYAVWKSNFGELELAECTRKQRGGHRQEFAADR